jgi:hypothetical protein
MKRSKPNFERSAVSPMKNDPVIGYCQFADGAMRPIYDDGRRQYLIDDDGYPDYGVWLIPEEVPAPQLIVPTDERRPS